MNPYQRKQIDNENAAYDALHATVQRQFDETRVQALADKLASRRDEFVAMDHADAYDLIRRDFGAFRLGAQTIICTGYDIDEVLTRLGAPFAS